MYTYAFFCPTLSLTCGVCMYGVTKPWVHACWIINCLEPYLTLTTRIESGCDARSFIPFNVQCVGVVIRVLTHTPARYRFFVLGWQEGWIGPVSLNPMAARCVDYVGHHQCCG